MEETPSEDSNTGLANIDIDSTDFYENVRTEIDSDLARMKKNVLLIRDLRLVAAEVEVESAALFHAELWYDLIETQNILEENFEDEDMTMLDDDNDEEKQE